MGHGGQLVADAIEPRLMGSPRAGGQNQGQAVRAARAGSGVILLLFLSMRGRRRPPPAAARSGLIASSPAPGRWLGAPASCIDNSGHMGPSVRVVEPVTIEYTFRVSRSVRICES